MAFNSKHLAGSAKVCALLRAVLFYVRLSSQTWPGTVDGLPVVIRHTAYTNGCRELTPGSPGHRHLCPDNWTSTRRNSDALGAIVLAPASRPRHSHLSNLANLQNNGQHITVDCGTPLLYTTTATFGLFRFGVVQWWIQGARANYPRPPNPAMRGRVKGPFDKLYK